MGLVSTAPLLCRIMGKPLTHPVDVPQLSGLDVPEPSERTTRRFARLTTPEWSNLKDSDSLTIDFVVMVNLLLEMRGNLFKTPLTNDEINIAEIFNSECHDRKGAIGAS